MWLIFANVPCILEQYCIFFTGSGCCEFHLPIGLSSKFTPSTSVVLFYILSLVSLLFLPKTWFVDVAIVFVFVFNLSLLSSSLGPHPRNRFQNSGLKLLPCGEIRDIPGSIIESAVDLF